MSPKIKLFVIIGFVITIISSSCQREAFYFEYKVDGVVFPWTTRIIEGEELNKIANVSADQIIFNTSDETLDNINIGDVLLVGVCDLTPYGLIRKVTGIKKEESSVTINTSDASVCEAVKSGTITFSQVLTANDFEVDNLSKGMPSEIVKSFNGFRTSLNHVEAYNRDGKTVWIDGVAGIAPQIDVRIEIEDFTLKSLSVQTKISRIDEICLSSNGSFSGEGYTEVVSLKKSEPVSVAGLIFTPKISLVCGVNGSASGSVSDAVRQEVVYTSVITMDGNDFTHNLTEEKLIKDYETPVLNSDLNISVYVNPELTICLSGREMFKSDINGYHQLQADKTWPKWWNIYVGYKGTVWLDSSILNGSDDYSEAVEIPKVLVGSAAGQYSGF